MKTGILALVVGYRNDQDPVLLEAISEEEEIAFFRQAVESGAKNPVARLRDSRLRQEQEDEAFGDYVEQLISQPFVRQEILDHGIQWMKSRIKIEHYKTSERQAADMIANFAFKIVTEDPDKTDFFLSGPTARVRVLVFRVTETPASKSSPPADAA
ncbi:MAG: hypothetical protein AAB425_11145 [Bdellovibrionota bacterium]